MRKRVTENGPWNNAAVNYNGKHPGAATATKILQESSQRMRQEIKRMSRLGHKGVTLVEVLVAGMIIAVAVGGLVTLLMKGREIDTTDKHRRQARAIIIGRFENSFYHYLNYSKLGTTISDSTVTIDVRQGTPLTGTLGGTIVSTPVYSIPTKQVTLRVSWTEHNGEAQFVELTKWLCQAR
jgi:type II secretory pathway pseudopilin PulG